MKAEDIIEGLNKHIETRRSERGIGNVGHMVLQKEIMPHSRFIRFISTLSGLPREVNLIE